MLKLEISLEQLYQLVDQLPQDELKALHNYLEKTLSNADAKEGEKQVREVATEYKTASKQIKTYVFPVVIEYDTEENVYLADCPALQGCYTDGETYEEALENIRDAIKLHVEERLDSGEKIPSSEYVQIAL